MIDPAKMHLAGLDNDTRGWIMAIVSGIACVVGTSVICVDLIVRLFPGKRNFRIQDSNTFLASSLSLSFGVMLFSALYSMLPSSTRYFDKGGIKEQKAGFIMVACFVAGFFGIQLVSRVLHQFMPSHVVDCDHTHDEPVADNHSHHHQHAGTHSLSRHPSLRKTHSHPAAAAAAAAGGGSTMVQVDGSATETSPLLATSLDGRGRTPASSRPPLVLPSDGVATMSSKAGDRRFLVPRTTTASIVQFQRRFLSFVRDTKPNCDEFGPCYGYSDPCGKECFKHLSGRATLSSRSQTALRSSVVSLHPSLTELVSEDAEPPPLASSPGARIRRARSHESGPRPDATVPLRSDDGTTTARDDADDGASDVSSSPPSEDLEAQHHHHVPTNAFLSIGLQTVIAIALHKLPEGFITYATNHANAKLGFNVFMALFVHNIADGFAMALPLYMAIGSRAKAMLWSSLLGGFSQPLGAAAAMLWFKLARRSNFNIDNVAYACLFAATAGIMTSVALQIFAESLSLNHKRDMNIFFGFLGMTIMGISNALVA